MSESKFPWVPVIAASVGYCVDLFDTFLVPALKDKTAFAFGVSSAHSLSTINGIFSYQLCAQLAGALLIWGPIADKFGRRKVLYSSIALYGIASILTALTTSLQWFEYSRILAGIGLGGELGAGITLITEMTGRLSRGKGTMVVGFFGMLGVVFAAWLATRSLSWRTDYVIGGVAAFAVLAFRAATHESSMFDKSTPGAYWKILGYTTIRRFPRMLGCVLVGAPTFFVVSLLATGATEFGHALGMKLLPTGPVALKWTYISIAIGDIACGLLSQWIRSRRKSILIFHAITVIGFCSVLFWPSATPLGYYLRCAFTGFGIGYWANMVTNASEQWGTNVRATATIVVPNAVRALLDPINRAFNRLVPHLGYIHSGALIGFVCSGAAIIALFLLKDGFSRDLDFVEDIRIIKYSKPNLVLQTGK
jgi:MFS family permease